jgi:hypothetical protein
MGDQTLHIGICHQRKTRKSLHSMKKFFVAPGKGGKAEGKVRKEKKLSRQDVR